MKIALVFCALFALAAALPSPPVESSAPFASRPQPRNKLSLESNEEPEIELPERLTRGAFFTNQDHTRPQNREQFLFVRIWVRYRSPPNSL